MAHETLLSARHRGAFKEPGVIAGTLSDPDYLIHMDKASQEEQESQTGAERQIAAQRPKASFDDAAPASHTGILVEDLTKILKENGVNIGATHLLRGCGIRVI